MASPQSLLIAAVLAMSVSGCATTSEPDPTEVKLNDVDARLGRVERVVNNQSLVQLSQRLDALEAQMRELRGSVDQQQNSNEALRKQQRDLYADLDRRISALETGLKPGGTAPATSSDGGAAAVAPVAAGGADQTAYNRAFDSLKSSDFNGAISQFRDFLRTYPQSSLADNAQYWLGEAYYVTRDYDDAATAFRTVGSQYPQSRKSADALLKLGYTLREQKRLTEARATLNQVVQRYPGTDAARLATEQLGKLPPDAQ